MGCVLLLDGGHRTLGAGACGHPAAGDQLCKSSWPVNDMSWVIDGIIWIGVFGEIEVLVG